MPYEVRPDAKGTESTITCASLSSAVRVASPAISSGSFERSNDRELAGSGRLDDGRSASNDRQSHLHAAVEGCDKAFRESDAHDLRQMRNRAPSVIGNWYDDPRASWIVTMRAPVLGVGHGSPAPVS